MKSWLESIAGDWPIPEGAGYVGTSYADVGEAWPCVPAGIKLWIAARLAQGWPERVRLLAATAAAVTAILAWFDELPLDAVPDVAGPLSRVKTQDDVPARADALEVLEHLEVLERVVRSKHALTMAWMQLADPSRRSEDAWRETTELLRDAVRQAYAAIRVIGPVGMPPEAAEAILAEVDWVR